MEIKKRYEIKDRVWIHIGGSKLTEGIVVEYFDLGHMGHSREVEFYVIEISTEIDPIYEVRTWQQMSQDRNGPIAFYRNLEKENFTPQNLKAMSRLGIEIPIQSQEEQIEEMFDHVQEEIYEDGDPTPEEVNAALDRAIQSRMGSNFIPNLSVKDPKKRFYNKKKKDRRLNKNENT